MIDSKFYFVFGFGGHSVIGFLGYVGKWSNKFVLSAKSSRSLFVLMHELTATDVFLDVDWYLRAVPLALELFCFSSWGSDKCFFHEIWSFQWAFLLLWGCFQPAINTSMIGIPWSFGLDVSSFDFDLFGDGVLRWLMSDYFFLIFCSIADLQKRLAVVFVL